MAVIAQAERKMISARTKAALSEARKRVAVTGQRIAPADQAPRLSDRRSASTGAGLQQTRRAGSQSQRRRAGGGSGVDDRRLEGRGHHCPPTAWPARSTLGAMRPLGAAGGRPGAFSTSRLGWLEANLLPNFRLWLVERIPRLRLGLVERVRLAQKPKNSFLSVRFYTDGPSAPGRVRASLDILATK